MYVNIRTHCDGNNVERSVNRGFIGESTFPQGGRRSRGVYARSSIPVRARFRTFTCTRWLRSLPRTLSSILPRICIGLVRESISCESTVCMHSDQGNLSFSCLPSNLSCFTCFVTWWNLSFEDDRDTFSSRIVDYYVLLSNICSMLNRSMNDSFYSSFFFFFKYFFEEEGIMWKEFIFYPRSFILPNWMTKRNNYCNNYKRKLLYCTS